jgi:hypothetical protein
LIVRKANQPARKSGCFDVLLLLLRWICQNKSCK